MLEIRDITKIYNQGTVTEQTLFDHFSLTVDEGQFVSIVGSNGSGKTSLLNIICGSIPIEGGDVLVGGKSISKLKDYQRYATMGRVYQNPAAGTTAVIFGSVIYKLCIQVALSLGLPANMMKLITAMLFLLVLVLSGRKGEEIIHA